MVDGLRNGSRSGKILGEWQAAAAKAQNTREHGVLQTFTNGQILTDDLHMESKHSLVRHPNGRNYGKVCPCVYVHAYLFSLVLLPT